MFIIENPVKMIPPFTETAIYWGDGNDNEGKKSAILCCFSLKYWYY